jgi:hypothetical protein
VLILSFPRPCSIAPSVTTPLYSTTVSQPLRQTLRGTGPTEYPPVPATHGTNWHRGSGGGDTCFLTSFNVDGERFLNTSSETAQSLSNALRADSNGEVLENRTGDPRGCFSSSHALKPNISCLLLPISIGYDDRWGMMLIRGAGGEGLAKGLYEKILKERAEEVYRRDIHPMVRYYVENGMIATLPTRQEREKLT